MSEPEEIAAALSTGAARRRLTGPLAGKRVLVSAGGTREPLDAVRFLGNRSSGRMGVALAAEARRRGANVTLLAANLAVPRRPASRSCRRRPLPSSSARRWRAPTAADVVAHGRRGRRLPAGRALGRQAPEGRRAVAPRARADRRHPARSASEPQRPGARGVRRRVGRRRASTRKRAMLDSKNVDLVVYNDVGRDGIGFDAADNEVVLVTRRGRARGAEGAEGADRRGRRSTRSSGCSRSADGGA